MDRMVTIALGEMFPEDGMNPREIVTRSQVDKSSFPIAGNGIPHKISDRRRGTVFGWFK